MLLCYVLFLCGFSEVSRDWQASGDLCILRQECLQARKCNTERNSSITPFTGHHGCLKLVNDLGKWTPRLPDSHWYFSSQWLASLHSVHFCRGLFHYGGLPGAHTLTHMPLQNEDGSQMQGEALEALATCHTIPNLAPFFNCNHY